MILLIFAGMRHSKARNPDPNHATERYLLPGLGEDHFLYEGGAGSGRRVQRQVELHQRRLNHMSVHHRCQLLSSLFIDSKAVLRIRDVSNPGSEFFPSRIPDLGPKRFPDTGSASASASKNFQYFNPKNYF
jgi:hypothetical protein